MNIQTWLNWYSIQSFIALKFSILALHWPFTTSITYFHIYQYTSKHYLNFDLMHHNFESNDFVKDRIQAVLIMYVHFQENYLLIHLPLEDVQYTSIDFLVLTAMATGKHVSKILQSSYSVTQILLYGNLKNRIQWDIPHFSRFQPFESHQSWSNNVFTSQ